MAERKPLSLNQRANRILQELSRSRPAKPPPPPEEAKPRKVKLEGRRRLCKLSADDPSDDGGVKGFDDESWFDSPPPPPTEKKDQGEEDIRDILSDLTFRLECLSVEKPKKEAGVGPSKLVPEAENDDFGSANASLCSDSPDDKSEECKGKKVDEWSLEDGNNEGGECEWKEAEELSLENEDDIGGRWKEKEVEELNLEEEDKGGKWKGKVVEELDLEDEDEEGHIIVGSDKKGEDLNVRRYGDGVVDILDDEPDLGNLHEDNEPITMSGIGACKSLTFTLPAKVAKILYPHQREGLKWLWSLHCGQTGGILGDDMGLGKTMQMSSYLAGLFHSKLIKRALIVAPKTLLPHWIKELTVVGLSEKIKDYYGTSAKLRNYELDYVFQAGGVLLTTYDIIRNNFKYLRGDFFHGSKRSDDDIKWDYVILDEGHIIKNPSTQRAKSLLEIPSSHCIIISGTPIQNNLKELWALFNFCCPSVFGDKEDFKHRYESRILRGNDKNASDREKYVGSSVAKELRERIKPYFLRRLKAEVFPENDTTKNATLSRKNELIVWLRLSQCQRKLYEAFLNSELVHLAVNGSPLAAITILKKICDHPLLLTKRAAEEVLEGMDTMLNKDDIGMVEQMATNLANMTQFVEDQEVKNRISCKTSFVLSLLENLIPDGHNVLIFSQTRKMLNLIQEAITSVGYKFLRIDGTTKISDREKTVKDFQAGKAPIFLLTSRVGGLGLTLTNADRVIVVDPAWNPSTDNQSVDRAYRIGQKKDVLVYRLMTCGTIEEKIYKMQVYKGGLFKIATEQKEQTRYFSKRDLQELFSLPKQGFDVSLTQQQMHEEHDCQFHMDESLMKHISFLEEQGIAGVSHHSLLFSKAATVPFVQDDTEEKSMKAKVTVRSWPSNSALELPVNGSEHAFNPKHVNSHFRKNTSRGSPYEVEDRPKEIEERIKRLSETLSNNALISRLPDKGEKIRGQIFELSIELNEIRESPINKTTITGEQGVIDIDDLTESFKHGLLV